MPIVSTEFEFPFRPDAEKGEGQAVLATELGDIKFWVRDETFSERYSLGEGGTSQVHLAIDAADASDFLRYAVGFTKAAPGYPGLHRVTPLALPYNARHLCSDLVLVQKGAPAEDPTTPGWPDWPWLEYKATFGTRPYMVLADDDTPGLEEGGRDELCRYVSRALEHTLRERKVPTWALETKETPPATNQPIPEPGFIPDSTQDWCYVWHQLPVAAIPRKAIAKLQNKVNDAVFDGVAPDVGPAFEAGTVLFAGVVGRIEPYYGPDGALHTDLCYRFRVREKGWNNYVNADGTTVPFGYRDSDEKLYKQGPFQKLFVPYGDVPDLPPPPPPPPPPP